MAMQVHVGPQAISYIVTAAIVTLVIALRLRTMRRARRLRLETLWIVPAIIAVSLGAMIWEYPPRDAITWGWLGLAIVVGALLGWRRAKLMRITVDPETHALNQQVSPAAMLFIVVLIVARQGLRYEAAEMGLNILKVTGILTAFMLGLLTATRVEMFIRARRLLTEARAGYPSSGATVRR